MILALLLAGGLAAAEPVAEVGFVFFGDGGTGRPAQARVAQAVGAFYASARCDFLVLLGDNVMPDGVSGVDDPQWRTKVEDPYGPLGLPIRPVLGNHDHRGDPEAEIAYSERSGLWDMPAAYYTFTVGPVAFFALDTDVMDAAQRRWLAEGLRRATAPWIVVYGHHPLRSGGAHGPARGAMRRVRCLVERRADFYLGGHDHGQEVIRGRATQVVMGSGGSPPRAIEPGPDTLYAASRWGFGHLQLDADRAVLTVVGDDGEVGFAMELLRDRRP